MKCFKSNGTNIHKMENSMQFISCKNLKVVASIEYHHQELHDAYLPFNVLFLIKKGKLHLKHENGDYAFGKNKIVLVKRYTKGDYYKSFTKSEGCAQMYAVAFHDILIRNVIAKIPNGQKDLLDEEDVPPIREILDEDQQKEMLSFFENMFLPNAEVKEADVQEKIVNILTEILSQNPEILKIFKKVSIPVKADLKVFMEYHYLEDFNVNYLARLSGRSQATFYRDFYKEFHTSPHKWILSKRLADARKMLEQEEKSASQIYLDLGFKDLSHFSKSFKKEFGITPSLVTKQKQSSN